MISTLRNRVGDVLTVVVCAVILAFGALAYANATPVAQNVGATTFSSVPQSGGALSEAPVIAPVTRQGAGGALAQP